MRDKMEHLIYFDSNKKDYGFEVEGYVASVSDEVWMKYYHDPPGTTWDIIDGQFVQIVPIESIDEKIKANELIQALKTFLESTDYIVTKISEAQAIYPETVSELINHYRKELDERVMARDEIRRLEKLVSGSSE